MLVYGGVLMAANIKPLKMCINVTIPSVEDTDLSLYEAMCTLAGKLQDTIKEINEILADAIVTVNGKEGPNVELKGSDISVSDTDDQSIDGALSKKYSAENPPPYPVTSVNGKTGTVTLAAEDISTTSGSVQQNINAFSSDIEELGNEVNTVQQDLSTKLAFTDEPYTSWVSVRNQPCGVYRTSGFIPWSDSLTDNGLLFILGNTQTNSAYIFIRNSVPDTLYFSVGNPSSSADWYLIHGQPVSG